MFENEWKKDYYKALFPLNPNKIIPVLAFTNRNNNIELANKFHLKIII